MLHATGVILAGGKSVRMKTDKSVLKIGNLQMIQYVALKLLKILPEVMISGNDPEMGRGLKLAVIPDRIDNRAPLCGIHAALYAAKFEYICVAACDMPFVTERLFELLVREGIGYDVTVPRHGAVYEPLLAVYRKSCLPAIESYLLAGNTKTDGFYKAVSVNYVDIDKHRDIDKETVFFNVNTVHDLRKAREIAEMSS